MNNILKLRDGFPAPPGHAGEPKEAPWTPLDFVVNGGENERR
jgi:hypothetical protein